MRMLITSNSIPQVSLIFDKKILYTHKKFSEDSETLAKIYHYIKNRLDKKPFNDVNRLENFLKIEREFLQLYERAVAKEKEVGSKGKNKTQRPFYIIEGIDPRYETIFRGLRHKSRRYLKQ